MKARREARNAPDLQAVTVITQPFDAQVVMAMLDKIVDYDALIQTTASLSIPIPPQRPSKESPSDEELKQLHHALFEVIYILARTPPRPFPMLSAI